MKLWWIWWKNERLLELLQNLLYFFIKISDEVKTQSLRNKSPVLEAAERFKIKVQTRVFKLVFIFRVTAGWNHINIFHLSQYKNKYHHHCHVNVYGSSFRTKLSSKNPNILIRKEMNKIINGKLMKSTTSPRVLCCQTVEFYFDTSFQEMCIIPEEEILFIDYWLSFQTPHYPSCSLLCDILTPRRLRLVYKHHRMWHHEQETLWGRG